MLKKVLAASFIAGLIAGCGGDEKITYNSGTAEEAKKGPISR